MWSIFILFSFFRLGLPEEVSIVRDDLEIRKSANIKTGTFRVADVNDDGVLHLRGDGLTIDFQGATLVGVPEGTKPDEFIGRVIVAEGCKNLTIKNANLRGFKIGMYFKNCDGLTVEGCDVSGNYRQHLKSTPKAEDQSDWLYGHENDKNEWFRYGAGIYVEDSKKVTLSKNKARNGQNGICVSKVNDSWIFDNDMSFMSGWGLAMWRSSRNDVSNNKFDWCMRGFSYGVYHRGQDSTGILVYEQCSDNVFAYNSATHGGDGFFLYAGNETLERTGEGGCNRNLLYRNDFSHAAANGIEATFSDGNMFVENILDECDHGIWGGYSYNTLIAGNKIRNNNNGISIEHGHNNRIQRNEFENNTVAVNLWQNSKDSFVDKPYGKKVDTLSHGYGIFRNSFRGGKVALSLRSTSEVQIGENEFASPVAIRVDGERRKVQADRWTGSLVGISAEALQGAIEFPKGAWDSQLIPPKIRGTQDTFLPANALRGRKYIFVDDWGPYDFSKIRLFPERVSAWGTAEFFLLGPEGEFQIENVRGDVKVAPASAKLPATIKVSAEGGSFREFQFTVKSGKESLEASGILLATTWDLQFFSWDSQGPQKPPRSWDTVIGKTPIDSMRLDKIDFKWDGRKPSESVPQYHFALVAKTRMDLPAGEYEFRTISDDGVRMRVDSKLAIDNWTWHGPTEDKATLRLEKGSHEIQIEYFQIDGFSQLQFWIEPAR